VVLVVQVQTEQGFSMELMGVVAAKLVEQDVLPLI